MTKRRDCKKKAHACQAAQMKNMVPFENMDTLRRTRTTRKLRGTRKRFMRAEREASGTYLPRSVPIQGKYIPHIISNTIKPIAIACLFSTRTGTHKDTAATPKTNRMITSGAKCSFITEILNNELPTMIATIYAANIKPNGRGSEFSSLLSPCSAGVHIE